MGHTFQASIDYNYNSLLNTTVLFNFNLVIINDIIIRVIMYKKDSDPHIDTKQYGYLPIRHSTVHFILIGFNSKFIYIYIYIRGRERASANERGKVRERSMTTDCLSGAGCLQLR